MMNIITRPLVRYHGGKWKIAPWIIEHFTPHRVYVEPFGGGGSVLLRKERSYAEVYNDLDNEIVNLFKVARDRGSELQEKLILTPFAREEFKNAFLYSEDEIERARRTVIKAYMSHGSSGITYRKSSLTGFRVSTHHNNVPTRSWRDFPEAFKNITERLQGVLIENKPAIDVMHEHDGINTLHYVDPPYVHNTRERVQGYKHELSDADHEQLSEVLHSLKGNVILSGYPSELYNNLYSDWEYYERSTFADHAAKRIECVWIKNPIPRLF